MSDYSSDEIDWQTLASSVVKTGFLSLFGYGLYRILTYVPDPSDGDSRRDRRSRAVSEDNRVETQYSSRDTRHFDRTTRASNLGSTAFKTGTTECGSVERDPYAPHVVPSSTSASQYSNTGATPATITGFANQAKRKRAGFGDDSGPPKVTEIPPAPWL